MEGLARLLEGLGKLLGSVAWPLVIVAITILFKGAIRSFLASLESLTIKGGGIEATASKAKQQAIAALAGAAATRAAQGDEAIHPAEAVGAAQSAVSAVADVTPKALRRLEQQSILWVDDKPSNNVFERSASEALGISIVTALTTDEAVAQVQGSGFNLVITDMSRPPDPEAAYTLIERLRAIGDRTPVIIYSGITSPEAQHDAKRRGAVGHTSMAPMLIRMVLKQLGVG